MDWKGRFSCIGLHKDLLSVGLAGKILKAVLLSYIRADNKEIEKSSMVFPRR